MKNKFYMKRLSLGFALLLLFSFQLTATNGYFGLGYGTLNKGAAGAGIANYHYSLINGNPAGNVLLGKTYMAGLGVFAPFRQYTVSGNPSGIPGTFGLMPGTAESDKNYFVVPYIGANWVFADDNALGIAIFGNGGMNTTYPTQTFFDQSVNETGVDLAQLFANVTYSRRLSEKHSLGITAILAYQRFEALGLSNFGPFSSDATKLTNNGHDNSTGFGFKVGYQGEITDGLSIGGVFQSTVSMGKFSDYAGLFAEGGDFDIPMSWTAGIAYDVSDKLKVMLDVKQILYSKVNSVSNPIDAMALPPAFLNPGGDPNNPADYTPNPNHVPLGANNGSGFGWDDMTIFSLGLEFSPNEDWTFRGGFSHGNNPISESEVMFNILAPGVIENHLALGFSRGFGQKGGQVHFSFNYAFNNSISGPNPFDFDPTQSDPANGVFVPNQTIELEMNQLDFEVGVSF